MPSPYACQQWMRHKKTPGYAGMPSPGVFLCGAITLESRHVEPAGRSSHSVLSAQALHFLPTHSMH